MGLTVRECLSIGALAEATLVAGAAGLDNVVEHVTVAEVPEAPGELLGGGELMVTALYAVRDDWKKQCALLRKLASAGVSGVVVFYVGVYVKQLAPEVVRLADELKLPLLVMPEGRLDMRYIDVISPVMEAIINRRDEQGQKAEYVRRTGLRLLKDGTSAEGILASLAETVGASLLVLDPSFRPLVWHLVDSHRGRLAPESEAFAERCRRVYAGVATAGEDGELPLVVRPVVAGRAVLGYLCALAGAGQELDEAADAIAEIMSIALRSDNRIDLVRTVRERCARLLTEGNVAEVERMAQHFSGEILPVKQLNSVAVVELGPLRSSPGVGDLCEAATTLVQSLGYTALVTGDVQRVFVFFDRSLFRGNHGRLRSLGYELGRCFRWRFGAQAWVGISGEGDDWRSLPLGVRQAMSAVQVGRVVFRRETVWLWEDVRLARLFCHLGEGGREFADAVLGRLAEYDEIHGTEYLRTLETYLVDCGGNMRAAAAELGLHLNTLKYRLRVARRILGQDFTAWPAKAEAFLAIIARRLLR